MWRYQTDERSVHELWQVVPQQDYAAMDGVGMTSPNRTSSAWRSANAALRHFDTEPPTARPQNFDGCWTQLCHNRRQCSSPVSCHSTGLFSHRHSASAPASYPSQATQAGYTQRSLPEAQWQSPSNHHIACHRHTISQQQQPTQLDSELTAALSFTAAPGRLPILCSQCLVKFFFFSCQMGYLQC